NRFILALIAFLLIMHLQTEVVYGKYFLGLWEAQQ
ncbi:putative membrane protein, partial [Vibrio harveyi]